MMLYIGHADKVRESKEGRREEGRGRMGGGGKWANGVDILLTTVSFSVVVCRHFHRYVSPT